MTIRWTRWRSPCPPWWDARRLGGAILLLALLPMPLTGCASGGPVDASEAEARLSAVRADEIELIRSTVPEQERVERLMLLLEERNQLLAGHTQALRRHRERIYKLNADYDTDRESFEKALAAFNEARQQAQLEFAGWTQAMKKETSSQEWKVISKYQLKRLDPRTLVYSRVPGES